MWIAWHDKWYIWRTICYISHVDCINYHKQWLAIIAEKWIQLRNIRVDVWLCSRDFRFDFGATSGYDCSGKGHPQAAENDLHIDDNFKYWSNFSWHCAEMMTNIVLDWFNVYILRSTRNHALLFKLYAMFWDLFKFVLFEILERFHGTFICHGNHSYECS